MTPSHSKESIDGCCEFEGLVGNYSTKCNHSCHQPQEDSIEENGVLYEKQEESLGEKNPEWQQSLKNLPAINYNLYFGSPARRADKSDELGEKERFDKAFDAWRNTVGGWPARNEVADWCFEYFAHQKQEELKRMDAAYAQGVMDGKESKKQELIAVAEGMQFERLSLEEMKQHEGCAYKKNGLYVGQIAGENHNKALSAFIEAIKQR